MKKILIGFLLISGSFVSQGQSSENNTSPSSNWVDPADIRYKPDFFVFTNVMNTVGPADSLYYKKGFSIGVGANLLKEKYIGLRLSFAYSRLRFDKKYFEKDYRNDNSIAESVDLSFESKDRELVIISPEIKITPLSEKKLSPYVVLGLSGTFGLTPLIIEAKTTEPSSVLDPFTAHYGNNYDASKAKELTSYSSGRMSNSSSFMVNYGIGLDYFPSKHIGGFIEAKRSTELLSYESPQWHYTTFSLGLSLRY